jgi:DNA-binding response OmpR family regulator
LRSVLLVDDDPDIASLVSLCLETLGIEVVQVRGLSEAIDASSREEVGLVLLDLSLGSEDGLAILPHLRADPHLEGVPVVAFTAHDSRRKEALQSGVDSFIARPFASGDLTGVVQALIVH